MVAGFIDIEGREAMGSGPCGCSIDEDNIFWPCSLHGAAADMRNLLQFLKDDDCSARCTAQPCPHQKAKVLVSMLGG